MQPVSLTTAYQKFSKLIKEVERGKSFVVTRRGHPIANLTLDNNVNGLHFHPFPSKGQIVKCRDKKNH